MTLIDPTPIRLKPDDLADAPAPDLSALNVELADLLARAHRAIGDVLDALDHSRDLIDGHRLARIWSAEAQAMLAQATTTRERLGRGMRTAGLLSAPYTSGGR